MTCVLNNLPQLNGNEMKLQRSSGVLRQIHFYINALKLMELLPTMCYYFNLVNFI